MKKSALITGGTGGIGRELVRTFCQDGYRVFFTYFHSKEEARRLEQEFGAEGRLVDLSDPQNTLVFAEAFLEQEGAPDVLIHNAGLASYGPVQDVDLKTFRSVSAVNFESPFFLTKVLLPGMIARKSGAIVNIASVWGECGASCEVLYSATKAALIGFTKALAKELAPSAITVNSVSPAAVDTRMLAGFSQEEKDEIASEYPIGRLIEASEVAKTCLFLAKGEVPALTGQVIGVNGGYCGS